MAEVLKLVPCSYPLTGGKIAFVAEAPGETEVEKGEVLVGASGQEFSRMLRDAGVVRSECLLTNVFNFRLPSNNVRMISDRKSEMPPDYQHGPVEPGAYVRPEFLGALDRLKGEIERVGPNVIVPMGNTALWAICGVTGITKYRGYVLESSLLPGVKVIPTFHPANILRAWGNRIFFLADVMKALTQSEYPDIRRPDRELWLYPTIEDIYDFEQRYMGDTELLGVDIETWRGQITCLGFSPDPEHGLVVPFIDRGKSTYSYWHTLRDEVEAWRWVKRTMQDPLYPKLFQNGMYDIFWQFTEPLNIRVANAAEDTMILHHALHPELPKSLHFLGSIYTEEIAWKLERPRGTRTEKREDT